MAGEERKNLEILSDLSTDQKLELIKVLLEKNLENEVGVDAKEEAASIDYGEIQIFKACLETCFTKINFQSM